MYTIDLKRLDVEHLIKQYIFYVSIFYCIDFDMNDDELNNKIKDLQTYINERMRDVDVQCE